MRVIFYLFVVITILSACSQQPAGSQKSGQISGAQEGSVIQDMDTICFERYSSLKKQDTASIMMIVDGSRVSGGFSNFPYQKDARIGTIEGTKTGNLIKGIWRYQQEGMKDSITIEFKLEGDKLLQKATAFDQNTGREVPSDTAAFRLLFDRINCQNIDHRMRRN